jgi:predicted amino acid-binding ACT domain protein
VSATPEEKTIARVLHAFGVPYVDIGQLLLRPTTTITYWCDKAKAQARREKAQIRTEEKRASGKIIISSESHRKGYLRSLARREAQESGEPVEEIYKRWDVVSKHSRRVY